MTILIVFVVYVGLSIIAPLSRVSAQAEPVGTDEAPLTTQTELTDVDSEAEQKQEQEQNKTEPVNNPKTDNEAKATYSKKSSSATPLPSAQSQTQAVQPLADTTAPLVSITDPVAHAQVDDGFVIKGTASDADSGIDSVEVVIKQGVTTVYSATAQFSQATLKWSLNVPKGILDVGLNYSISATATDNSSNQTTVKVMPISLKTLESILKNDPRVSIFYDLLSSQSCHPSLVSPTTRTLFVPSNSAFNALPSKELQALKNHPDELCELLAHHVHLSNSLSLSDIISKQQIITHSRDGLVSVSTQKGSVFIDQAKVINPDNTAADGVYHVINDVLLPVNQRVNINMVKTNYTSPRITGTYAAPVFPTAEVPLMVCITLRINGQAYQASVNDDGTWYVPKDTVKLDPLMEQTLFSVIARTCQDDNSNIAPAQEEDELPESSSLIALTMRRNVLKYSYQDQRGNDDGSVLGATDSTTATEPATVYVASTVVTKPGIACVKGWCSQLAQAGGDADAKRTEKPMEQAAGQLDEQADEDEDISTPFYWWILGGAAVAILWYLLWRRAGVEE